MAETKVTYPIFDVGVVELAELSIKLHCTVRYLEDVRDGRKPLRSKFRARAVDALQKSEEALFGPEEPAS